MTDLLVITIACRFLMSILFAKPEIVKIIIFNRNQIGKRKINLIEFLTSHKGVKII